MKKIFFSLFLAVLLFSGCSHIEKIKHYIDTHIVFDENPGMSIVPGVLAEWPNDEEIILEFDNDVEDDIFELLRLTDYTEQMPAKLPESLPGVRFYKDPDDDRQVIVDVSSLDCTEPKPVTLIYDNEKEPVLAHIMLVQESSPDYALKGEKSYSAVISDIHLNDARSQTKGWAWCRENIESLTGYLDKLIEEKDRYRELVLLGDVIDEYVTPVPYVPFAGPDGTIVTEKEYISLIAEANKEILEKFKEVQAAGIQLICVPGNHDCGLDAKDVKSLFGPDAVFVSDARGLGTYVPEYGKEISMEHGHRYDITCAPDRVSNIGTDDVTAQNAFIGAQYFITRIAATHDYLAKQPKDNIGIFTLKDLGLDEDEVRKVAESDGESSTGSDDFNLLTTKVIWNVVCSVKDVPGLDTLSIATGLYGLTRGYTAPQYSFLGENPNPELYKSMYVQEEWEERLKLNNAPSGFPYLLGAVLCEVPIMDTYAVSWLARRDREHRIFIWGHTHNPLMMAERFDGVDRGYIYVNTGSWVDDGVCNHDTRSFVTLYFGEDGYIQVSLRQVNKDDGSIGTLYSPLWLKR